MKARLGKNVRRYRERIGLSQLELAEAIGKSEASVGLLERGKVWPEYESIQKISEVLAVPEDLLFEGTPSVLAPTPREALAVLAKMVENAEGHAHPEESLEELIAEAEAALEEDIEPHSKKLPKRPLKA